MPSRPFADRRLLAAAACLILTAAATGASAEEREANGIEVDRLADRVRSLERSASALVRRGEQRASTVDAALNAIGPNPSAAQIFAWVDDRIEFVPYRGAVRGPRGVLESRAGNAPDQAALLGELFRAAGIESRYAIARLSAAQTEKLVQSYAGRARLVATEEVETGHDTSSETADRFRGLVERHVWVEFRSHDGSYVRADPVLTDEIGAEGPEADDHVEALDDPFGATLALALEAEFTDGQHRRLYSLESDLSELAYRPVRIAFPTAADLENQVVPRVTVEGSTETGKRFVPEKLETLTITYRTTIGDREHHYRQPLIRPQTRDRRLLRDDATLSVLVAPGPMTPQRLARRAGVELRDAAGVALASLDGDSELSEASAGRTAQRVARALGGTAPLLYARHLDLMAAALGRTLGVRAFLLQPRIYRTVVDASDGTFTVDIGARGGRLEAVPKSGLPESAASGFLTLYGRAESQLRRALVQKLAGRADISVEHLFELIRERSVPVATLHRDNLDRLTDYDIPEVTRRRMKQQVVERGWLLLTPTAEVETDRGPAFGWWSLDPQTGLLRGNIGTSLSDVRLGGGADSTPTEIAEHAVDVLERTAATVEQTVDDSAGYRGLVCGSLDDTLVVARSFCATEELLSLPSASQCIETPRARANPPDAEAPGGIDLRGETCWSRAAKLRCGATIADGFLTGRLSAGASSDQRSDVESLNCLD